MAEDDEASQIIQCALRDMDDLITECITASENSKFQCGNTDRNDSAHGSSQNQIEPEGLSAFRFGDHPKQFVTHINCLVNKIKSSLRELKQYEEGSDLLSADSQQLVGEAIKEVMDFMRQYIDENEANGVDTRTRFPNPDNEALSTMRNQINYQAMRIAELEQQQKQNPSVSASMSSPNGWDQLDLMAELSRQKIQIAGLGQMKQRLEEQLSVLNEQVQLSRSYLHGDSGVPFQNGDDTFPPFREASTSTLTPGNQPHYYLNRPVYGRTIPRLQTPGMFSSQYNRFGDDGTSVSTLTRPDHLAMERSVYEKPVSTPGALRIPHKSISLNELTYNRLNMLDSPSAVPLHTNGIYQIASSTLSPGYDSSNNPTVEQSSLVKSPMKQRNGFRLDRMLSPSRSMQGSTSNFPGRLEERSVFPCSPTIRRVRTPNERRDHSELSPSPTMVRNQNDAIGGDGDSAHVDLNGYGRSFGLKHFLPNERDFAIWDRDMVSAFLYELGLGDAVSMARRNIRQGSDLIFASRKELEHSTGIHNPLHVKKLLLHIQLRTKESVYALTKLSPHPMLSVTPVEFNMTEWLEDIGLTTYANHFQSASVDALVLNNLTVEDLLSMKITNELHFLSLRRGLQVLRRLNFDTRGYLRATPLLIGKMTQTKGTSMFTDRNDPGHLLKGPCANGDIGVSIDGDDDLPLEERSEERETVSLWTQCRIMAWLHAIELPEYAPQLVGSGVHGGLLILEDRFSADLLADILHIPVSKTLVRRHLSNKFADLVGESNWKRKLSVLGNPDIPTLTLSSKIKSSRKHGLFSNRKQKHSVQENELLCPVNIEGEHGEMSGPDTQPGTEAISIPQPLQYRETDL